jgi:hypothetical protein
MLVERLLGVLLETVKLKSGLLGGKAISGAEVLENFV